MSALATIAAPSSNAAGPTGLFPGATPAAGAGAAGVFDFGALLLAMLGGAELPQPDTDGQDDTAADADATATDAAAAAGALAATAQIAPTVAPAAAGGTASQGATAASADPVATAAGSTTATAALASAATSGAAVAPAPAEGRTLGSRETAGVVVEAGGRGTHPDATPEAADTGTGAVRSAPSDLPSIVTPVATPATDAPATPDAAAAVAASALHEPAPAKIDAAANDPSGDRHAAAIAANGPEVATLQAAHPGAHHDTTGDGRRREGSEARQAVAEPEAPAPTSVPFQAPARDIVHTEAPRLEPTPPRPLEHPEPTHAPARNEMRLEVGSDDLGKVEVRVVVHADSVHATLLAPQDQTREALAQHRASLEEALGRAQLRLDGFTVGAGPNDGQQGAERFDRSGAPTATRAGTPIGLAATEPATSEPTLAKGLSLRA